MSGLPDSYAYYCPAPHCTPPSFYPPGPSHGPLAVPRPVFEAPGGINTMVSVIGLRPNPHTRWFVLLLDQTGMPCTMK